MCTTVISFNLKFRLKVHIQQASAVNIKKKILATAEFEVGMVIIYSVSFKKRE